MLRSCHLIGFVATTDLGRARDFYEHVLGLPCVDANPGACLFDANGTTLRVSLVGELTTPPYTVLGWTVADIELAIQGLSGSGVTFDRFDGFAQDELGVWTTPDGDRVAWFKDPDGNVLSLTELVRPTFR